jgi:hypothetical protein
LTPFYSAFRGFSEHIYGPPGLLNSRYCLLFDIFKLNPADGLHTELPICTSDSLF